MFDLEKIIDCYLFLNINLYLIAISQSNKEWLRRFPYLIRTNCEIVLCPARGISNCSRCEWTLFINLPFTGLWRCWKFFLSHVEKKRLKNWLVPLPNGYECYDKMFGLISIDPVYFLVLNNSQHHSYFIVQIMNSSANLLISTPNFSKGYECFIQYNNINITRSSDCCIFIEVTCK